MAKTLCESCRGVLSSSSKVPLEKVIEHHAESCPAELGKIRKPKKAAPPPPEPEPPAPVRRVRKRVVTRL